MTTRKKLCEQCERLYMRSYDREDVKPKVERREIALLVDQAANEILSLSFKQAATIGVVEIPTCMIATYNTIEVKSANGQYYITLPATPLALPMDMGVWNITPAPTGISYIPIKSEFWNLLGSEDEGLLEEGIGFHVKGRKVFFTKQPAASVNIELLIVDPALLEEHDPYPVPPDMELSVVERVVALLHSRGLAQEKPKG